MVNVIVLNDQTRFGDESGAGLMRNRCAFTSKDMGYEFGDAFAYAIILGWDKALEEMAEQWDWDDELVAFLLDAHERFEQLSDRQGDDND